MRTMNVLVALALVSSGSAAADQQLIVHEWGTFTSLQNEKGDAIGGINVDTELLPAFVHNFAPAILPNGPQPAQPRVAGQRRANDKIFLGVPAGPPRLDVTMRLETPVVYFHLPPGASHPTRLDVQVRFPGGWLTQFYPNAKADIDGRSIESASVQKGPVTGTGGLTWSGISVGVTTSQPADGRDLRPATTSRVWLAPRDVRADAVRTGSGETEQYLFYRGVGRLDAPIRVIRLRGDELEIRHQPMQQLSDIPRFWLVEVAGPGKLAFRSVGPLPGGDSERPLRVRSTFNAADYSAAALATLQRELHAALVEDGLYADEAQALLNTWENSYFRECGLRLFFLVPRAWTDEHLPLTISAPSEMRRSLVGRVEIVTPEQRRIAHELTTASGRSGELRTRLGRFAEALLLDEKRSRLADAGAAAAIRH